MKTVPLARQLALNVPIAVYVTNAVVAMVVAWGWHLTTDQQGAIVTIVTGVLGAVNILAVRPVAIPALATAVSTVLTAFAAFHLHLDPNMIASTVAAGSILLAWLLHQSVVPAQAAAKGVTGTDLLLGRQAPR